MAIKESVFYWAVCDGCDEDIDEEGGLRLTREETIPAAEDYDNHLLVEPRDGADPLILCGECACKRDGHPEFGKWSGCLCNGRVPGHTAVLSPDGHPPFRRYCVRCSESESADERPAVV